MCKIVSVRLVGILGFLSLALFTASLVAFPSPPTTGASLSSGTPGVSVDRARKGDRLPMLKPTERRDEFGSQFSPARALPQGQIPQGCDPAFSPISSPSLGSVFRRCLA